MAGTMRGEKLNLCTRDHAVIIYTASECPVCALRRQVAELLAALAMAATKES